MQDLSDIPVIVNKLITFFMTSSAEAAKELIKGFTVNGIMKLVKLKDKLLGKPEVRQAVEEFQQNPVDANMKKQLEEVLTQALHKHPVFQQQNTTVQVKGNIKAKKGGVAAGQTSGKIIINNTFND